MHPNKRVRVTGGDVWRNGKCLFISKLAVSELSVVAWLRWDGHRDGWAAEPGSSLSVALLDLVAASNQC